MRINQWFTTLARLGHLLLTLVLLSSVFADARGAGVSGSEQTPRPDSAMLSGPFLTGEAVLTVPTGASPSFDGALFLHEGLPLGYGIIIGDRTVNGIGIIIGDRTVKDDSATRRRPRPAMAISSR